MRNEYYYKQELENLMEHFIDKETDNQSDFGWVSNNLARNMANAAFAVLKQNLDLNDYFTKEDMLKP